MPFLAHFSLPVTPERIREYVDIPIQIGREQARRLYGVPIRELAESKGICVRVTDASSKFAGLNYRGQLQYTAEKSEITIFKQSVYDLLQSINQMLLPADRFSYEKAIGMHIAHEFFHYIELSEIGPTHESVPSVDILKLFGRKRSAHIKRCDEIAAHAFSKEYIGLPFFPNMTDYLYLINSGKMKPDAFERLAQSAAQQYMAASMTKPVNNECSNNEYSTRGMRNRLP